MQGDSPRPGHSDYLDFDLEIGIRTGRDYPVAVLDSPAGGARGSMHFPFDELVLENRLLTLQNALLRSGGEPRRTLSPEEQKVRDFGRALFEALFIPEVRSCYDVSLREAARQGRGLRLKLRIQPPELAALPWEYLYHPGQCEYVSLSTQTPVVRYLEVPQRVQPLVVEPPLRILGMIASPSDLPLLDIEREKGRIEHAIQDLQARGMVDLVWLPGQIWRDLQRAMRQGPWHIFHFIGHGGFDRNAGEGLIALADREGRADRFHATRLGRLLADHPSLRLVLLNSCEGARGSERDVFSSTASILVRRGIPAVLAMQYEITDRAAVEFARTFYEALADGMPVDGAVAEARKAISFAVANTVEWGTPVLYTRAPGGVLFQVTGAPRVERLTTEEPRPPPQVEKRLERLYVDGLGAFWIEEWDEACRCFQAIVDEQPDYRDAAARLEQAEHQRRLVAFYTEAQAARAAKDWTGEFMALDRLVAEEPGFKDAADLREAAKRKRQLARLYAQAQELHAAGRWQAVVNVFTRIAALDPDYPDPDELLPAAEREVAEQKRKGELDDLYSHALREMDAGQWGEARGLLAQIQEMEAGYRETERLLARVESEIAEQRRQAELDGLHSDALLAVDAGRWAEARGLLAQIQEMEEGYRQTEQLLAKVEAELAEQQRQAELDGLYSRALREMNAGRWAEARQLLIEIQEQEPGYRATERLLAEAEARLEQETTARQAREAQRTSEPAAVTRPTASGRRLPGCVMAAIGGLGLITFIVAVVLLSGGLGGKGPAAIPTEPQEAMLEPTAAPEEPAPAPTEAPAQEAMPEPTEAPAPEQVFGPSSGSLLHEVDGKIEAYSADVSLTDFVAEAMFYNPYPSTQGDWDYGFTCRHPEVETLHVIYVESDGDWKHSLVIDGEWTSIESGTVSDLRTGADESNHLRIIVIGDSGEFYVNDQHVASLDMSGLTEAGDIRVATELLKRHEAEGEVTRFEDFSVWSLDVPVFGPSSGSLLDEVDGKIEAYSADVTLTDFVAEAMFYNPYPSTQGDWDYGFLCRRPRFDTMHAIRVESDGDWKHHVQMDREWTLLESGTVSDLRTGADQSNYLRIIVMGDSGEFYVNGQLVASLDMSWLTDAGDIKTATGIGKGDESEGGVIRFENFTVWSLD